MLEPSSPHRALLAGTCIALDSAAADGESLLRHAARLLHATHRLPPKALFERLRRRERRGSTALGWGVALPHADMPGLGQPVAAFVRTAVPLEFDAPDRAPVQNFLVLVVPRPASSRHFELLLHYRHWLARAEFRARLAACTQVPDVWQLFRQHEWHGEKAPAWIIPPQLYSQPT